MALGRHQGPVGFRVSRSTSPTPAPTHGHGFRTVKFFVFSLKQPVCPDAKRMNAMRSLVPFISGRPPDPDVLVLHQPGGISRVGGHLIGRQQQEPWNFHAGGPPRDGVPAVPLGTLDSVRGRRWRRGNSRNALWGPARPSPLSITSMGVPLVDTLGSTSLKPWRRLGRLMGADRLIEGISHGRRRPQKIVIWTWTAPRRDAATPKGVRREDPSLPPATGRRRG